MIFGAILAGGTGSRMKQKIPKQFIELNNVPIIIRTLKRMLEVNEFDHICIGIHPDYNDYLQDLFKQYTIDSKKILITLGGKERINSIENVLDCITKISDKKDDIIVIHDAVRPFVSKEILKNSIINAQKYGACVAVTPAVDTMYILNKNDFIQNFPNRKTIFNGQAPDSFNVQLLKNSIKNLTEEERKTITGSVQICAKNGHKIKTIQGDYKNIKITTENDLAIANTILKMEQ